MIDRQTIRYRPTTEDDVPFLRELYASTRADEMKTVPWSEEQKDQFLTMQFYAQKQHYDQFYCDADFLVIEKDGQRIGRLYLDRGTVDHCIIDIALVPEWRGSGIGTMLIREILDEAAAAGKPVTLYVEYYNPARHLYDRLGFRETGTNGVYVEMAWRGGEAAATAT